MSIQNIEDRERQQNRLFLEVDILQNNEDECPVNRGDDNATEEFERRRHLQQQDYGFPVEATDSIGCRSTIVRRDRVHYLTTLLAGVGSGALSSIVCAPLDLVRTRMQVWGDIQRQQENRKNCVRIGKTILKNNYTSCSSPREAFRSILKKEGPKGMFRGLGATLMTQIPLFWGVYFPLYDETKHCLQTNNRSKEFVSNYHPSVVHCLSAIFTGVIADLICNPLYVIRTRLQTQALHESTISNVTGAAACATSYGNDKKTIGNKIKPTSITQTANELYSKQGVKVFWRGMSANIIGLSHCAVQFPVYEFLKRYFRERQTNNDDSNKDNTVAELLAASGTAKMLATLLSYPHEVLRSRMVDDRSSQAPTLSGMAKRIFKKEGFVGYYNGLTVTLLRVVPNCCMTFLSYELILKCSKEYFGNNYS